MASSLLTHDPALEREVLAAVTVAPDGIVLDELGLSSADFSDERAAAWWTAISTLTADGLSITPHLVTRQLAATGNLGEGRPIDEGWIWRALEEAASRRPPTPTALRDQARLLRDCTRHRTRTAALRRAHGRYPTDPDGAIAELRTFLDHDRSGVAEPPLVDDVTVLSEPTQAYVMRDIVPQRGFVVLAGEPGTGKTFAALAVGLCVARGRTFLGFRVVERGPVLYSLAEGIGGRAQRVAALKQHYRIPLEERVGLAFFDRAFQLDDPIAVERFIRRATSVAPVLVVIDTLARHFGGESENDAAAMGAFIAGCDRIRDALGVAMIVVHHVNKAGQDMRGSSALRGAADVVLLLRRGDETITLSCDKSKDAEPFQDVRARLVPVGDSCVFDHDDINQRREGLSQRQRQLLDVLGRQFPTVGATAAQLIDAAALPKTTGYEALTALEHHGLVVLAKGKYHLASAQGEGDCNG